MRKTDEAVDQVAQVRTSMFRMWMMGGLLPLLVCGMLTLAVSVAWAKPLNADEHNIERGFQAVLAICSALFLTGFWLDGKWTNSERLARRIWRAAGGEQFSPSRSQLAAQAEIAFRTVSTSASALTLIGAAMAVAAVISAGAGLRMGEAAQILLLGLGYQLFVLSRHPYYDELLTTAARGELVAPEDDANHDARK
jgi:hypothetical protein